MKVAFIVGINGQDGTYLCNYLLSKNYKVFGVHNPFSKNKFNFILNPLIKQKKINIIPCDILKFDSLEKCLKDTSPNEIYYLATTHEKTLTIQNYNDVLNVNVNGLVNILEVIRNNLISTKVFYASSSNIFVNTKESPQNENTIPCPSSLYGLAKLTAMNIIKFYKVNYNLFICYGILYNHESILRKKEFLPIKIIETAIDIKFGKSKKLIIGSLEDQRDWSSVEDFVKAMWLMLQSKFPKNYIIGSGQNLKVLDIIKYTFDYLDLNWSDYVECDEKLMRNLKSDHLVADISKIKNDLGWSPTKSFKKVLERIIDEKLKNTERLNELDF